MIETLWREVPSARRLCQSKSRLTVESAALLTLADGCRNGLPQSCFRSTWVNCPSLQARPEV